MQITMIEPLCMMCWFQQANRKIYKYIVNKINIVLYLQVNKDISIYCRNIK